ncbi:MAG: DUF481 domain-containing protein, partial [Gammaproteobacteria bacterium]
MPLYHTLPRAAAALLGLTLAQVASADTIHMKGGDRLSGTIVDKQGDKLTLKTAYSNEAIVVLWSEVASVETEQPAKFMLKDRTVLTAQAAPGANETVVLKSGTTITTAPVALAEVDYINPPPYVTGEGVATAGRANLGLTMNRGNTDNNQLFYDAETVIRSIKNRFTIGALGVQKQEDGEETARNNRAYFKYDHFLTDKWYAYANTDVQEDKFKDLNLRTTLGVGSGYQYFDTKEKSLSLEGGLTYVDNDYDLAEDDNYAAGRWALSQLGLVSEPGEAASLSSTGAPEFGVALRSQLLVGEGSYAIQEQPNYAAAFFARDGGGDGGGGDGDGGGGCFGRSTVDSLDGGGGGGGGYGMRGGGGTKKRAAAGAAAGG